jgi:hypothetical protein
MGRSLLANAGTSSLISVVLTLVMVVPAASTTSAETTSGPYCVVILADADPTDVGGEALIAEERCFTTYEESFEYGSGGTVDVPAGFAPTDLTDSFLAATAATSTSVLIGRNYDLTDYQSNWWAPMWEWYAPSGCSATNGWYTNYVGAEQDDRYASARAMGNGCTRVRVFVDRNLQGANLLCVPGCANLAPLNELTSSVRWWGG